MARSVLGDPTVYDNLEKREMAASQEYSMPGTGVPGTGGRMGTSATGRMVGSPMRNGTGNRTAATPGRLSMSANGAPGSPGATLPVESEAEVYFKTLTLRKETASKARAKDKEMGETLASYLPMKERFALAKEKNVMALWQERQLEWQRIQQHIATKCNAPPTHSLMMTTTDEFRVKAEQYDVLQAAIPAVERFGPDSWQMTLRGGSSKVCTIGHIFSGLECELKSDRRAPLIVRRPRPVGLNTTMLTASGIIGSGTESTVALMTKRPGTVDDSSAMKAKKRRLKAHLKRIRPHMVTMELAEGLLLRAAPLFKWAEVSSSEYFQDQDEMQRRAEEEEALGGSLSARQEKEARELAATRALEDQGRGVKSMPTLSFATSTELVFTTNVGETTHKYVEFTNTGAIALNYSWRVDPTKYPVSAALASARSLRKTCLERNHSKVTRESVLAAQRTSFFCQRDSGKVLPGETIVTCFSYCNKSGGGIVNQSWLLDTVPRATVKLEGASAPEDVSEDMGTLRISTEAESARKPKNSAIETEVPLNVNFRGHTSNVDCKLTERTKASQGIDRHARTAYFADTLYQSVRRVRDPIRASTVDSRQKSLFTEVNDAFLRARSPRHGAVLPYFVTTERIREFMSYFDETSEGSSDLQEKLFAIVDASKRFSDIVVTDEEGAAVSMEALESRERALLEAEASEAAASLARVQAQFFPELELDNFDEVTLEDVTLHWGMDVEAVSRSCRANQRRASYFVDIERQLDVFLKEEEKERAKEQKRQEKLARQAARSGKKKRRQEEDSDEEEEEEEEEEEDDEAAAAAAAELRRLSHPEIVRSTLLANRCESLVSLFFVRPSATTLVHARGRELLLGTLDFMDEEDGNVRERAKWDPANEFTPFKCPFNTDEGRESWAGALAGQAAPAAGGKGKEVAAALPQQIDMIYRDMFGAVNERLLSGLTDVFAEVDEQATTKTRAEVVQSSQSLFSKSQLRVEDVQGQNKVVFVNFDGDAFTSGTVRNVNDESGGLDTSALILSAFDAALSRQQRALNAAYQCGINGAHAIVLLHEDSCACRPLTKSCGTISALLNEREAKRKAAYDALSARKQKKLLLEKGLQPVVQVAFDVVPCASLVELRLVMKVFLQTDSYKGQSKGTTVVPVFVLETLQVPGVVPAEPEMEEVVSDDEEAPLDAIGQDDFRERQVALWHSRRPHRVEVTVPVISAQAVAAVNQKRLSNVNSSMISAVLSDARAAVEEVIREAHAGPVSSALLVDACPSVLLQPRQGALQSLATGSGPDSCPRALSAEMRELLLWCGVCKFAPVLAAVQEDHPLVVAHYERLFRQSAEPTALTAPRMLYVAGGAIRVEKFRLLDEMLDMAGTVCIVGELAIPFVAAANSLLTLGRYADLCAAHWDVCKQLIAKARFRGVRLVLPTDLMVGEEPLKPQDWYRCVDKVEKDSRDEGGDYEDEIKVVSLEPRALQPPPVAEGEEPLPAPEGFESIVTQGYVYDLGPESCKALTREVENCDLLLVWGTVGVCEIGTFQAGQRALVAASVAKVSDDADDKPEEAAAPPPEAKKGKGKEAPVAEVAKPAVRAIPSQCLVVGDAAVEWYARFTDPEGEFNGNIQQAGLVAYAQRESALFTGVLSQYTLPFVTDVDEREPTEEEFVHNIKEVVEEEEEDEEDEEEDEDEDDDY